MEEGQKTRVQCGKPMESNSSDSEDVTLKDLLKPDFVSFRCFGLKLQICLF